MGQSLFSFFDGIELDTLGWEETDNGFLSFSNNEDVAYSSGESMSTSILHVCNIERTWVLLQMLENTNSANVVTSSDQD